MKETLQTALLAARSYSSGLKKANAFSSSPDAAESASVRIELDGHMLGRLVAPVVSAEIARQSRRKQVIR